MAKLPKITSRRQLGHAPYQTSDGLHCRSCFGRWPCEVYELTAQRDALALRVRQLEGALREIANDTADDCTHAEQARYALAGGDYGTGSPESGGS